MDKNRIISGWVLTIFISLILLASGTMKFVSKDLINNFEVFKLADWRIVIALGEIISTILFIMPKTNKFGTFLLSSFMGGAIVVHMVGNEPIFIAVALLIIIWVTYYLRNPQNLTNK